MVLYQKVQISDRIRYNFWCTFKIMFRLILGLYKYIMLNENKHKKDTMHDNVQYNSLFYDW